MLRPPRFRLLAACGLGLLLAGSAEAVMLPAEQARFVQIGGSATQYDPETNEPVGGGSDGDADSAPDFGPFDGSVGVALRAPGGSVDGIAQQQSTLGMDEIDVLLRADVNAAAGDFADASGSSVSSFLLSFDVDSARTWRIDARVSVGSPASGSYALTSGSETLVEGYDGSNEVTLVLLEPGRRYVLQALLDASSVSSGGFGYSTSGEITLRMTLVPVPEPGTGVLLGGALVALAAGRRARG